MLVPENTAHDDRQTRRETGYSARKQGRATMTAVASQDALQGRYDAFPSDWRNNPMSGPVKTPFTCHRDKSHNAHSPVTVTQIWTQ